MSVTTHPKTLPKGILDAWKKPDATHATATQMHALAFDFSAKRPFTKFYYSIEESGEKAKLEKGLLSQCEP